MPLKHLAYGYNKASLKVSEMIKHKIEHTDAGFTLPELMIVIAIAAILVSLGAPSMKESINKGRSSASAKVMRLALQNTRQAAVNKGKITTLCAGSGTACGGSWMSGWTSFVGDGVVDAGDFNELSSRGAYNSNVEKLTVTGDVGGTVIFAVDGSLVSGTAVSFLFCADEAEARYAREVTVAPSGIVTGSRDADGDGIHESYNGGALSCS